MYESFGTDQGPQACQSFFEIHAETVICAGSFGS
jgi:hypothetical protein